MVFLSPIFLVGLLAAAIPVAIHLIRREKPPKLMFSTIRFLKKTSKKLVLFQQLQQILLLLLRSAVIALLVLAFARPLFNTSVARLVDADPQSAVILLDLSMSMQYGEVFERARAEALAIVNQRSAGDEVALIGFSDSAQLVREFNTDLDAVANTIESIATAGYGATRYLPNLQLADQLLESSSFDNRAVYLVSDFQSSALPEEEDGWKLAPGVAFYPVDVGLEDTRNLVLTDVRSPPQLLEDAPEQQILARVRTTGSTVLSGGEATLWLNGEVAERVQLDLSERSEAVVSFDTAFAAEGSYSGEVRVSGDDFETDNSYYFTVDVLPKIRVLLVNGEASDNWFDDEGHWFGLAVTGGSGSPFELQSIQPAELSAAALRQSDVAVLLNVGNINDVQARALEDYVRTGGSLLLAPGDRVEAAVVNRQLGSILPARLLGQGEPGLDEYLVIADMDRRHPVLQPLGSDWSARFQSHWRLEPTADAQVLMQFDNTDPALIEGRAGEGSVMVFASSLDLEWSNLPLQGLYLPFVHETLRHLVQQDVGRRAYSVGDRIDLNPTGEARSVSGQKANGEALSFDSDNFVVAATAPGLLRATIDGVETRFAVNVLPGESNLNRFPPSNLYDRIINPDTSPVQSREVQTAQLIEELERPQRIWWWLLCLVMLLLLAETLIANRTYR